MSAPGPLFPWEAAMGFAFRVLRWTPETFWAATPRELAAAAGAFARPAPLSAGELSRLIARFPDAHYEEPP